ncbi:family S53 protease-like protein [Mycena rosella]|uniref:tripeptidyl-peptidase II n=1 Tax=Mycena rosella TaxID=1033263 RepID=A0AAD7G5I0_MYCRO|nr:family S53 protease-like protein [Mycena rosella]
MLSFCKLLAVLPVALAASAGPMVLHERRAAVPVGFVRQGAAPANEILTLHVALTSNNVAGLKERLRSASTPGSAAFRQWLSMDEVKAFAQPSPETVSAFNTFASANGLKPTVISANGDWVTISLPVAQANTLFAAEFEVFTHPSLPGPITRTLSVSLPAELVGHVEVLDPTTAFVAGDVRPPGPASSTIARDAAASCDTSVATGVITPACLQELYGIPTSPATEDANVIMVTAYEQEFAQTADLAQFLTLLRPDIPPNTTFEVVSLNEGLDPQGQFLAGLEANLDTQYTIGIATGVPVQFLTVGGTTDLFPTNLLNTTAFLDGVPNPPTVLTTSYGRDESDFGASLATKICNGYMALGARGITVLFSSGDGGVRGNHDELSICSNNTFLPVFPASCPFVTAVGSTFGSAPETAVNFTGGGFSNVFPTAFYQTAQVAGFLETLPADFPGIYNESGRGYPDVALQGWNFEIVAGNETTLESGTSASSPSFAGIIALLNDRLLAAGKPVLGFVNPLLIRRARRRLRTLLRGITRALSVAFDAAAGWDPLTGLGTPVFAELLAAAMAA